MFKAFLQLSCQLVDSNQAIVEIEGREIEFYTSDAIWQISTTVRSQSKIPSSIIGLLSQSLIARWGLKGIHFKYNDQSKTISIIQKITPLNNFNKFKTAILSFLKLLNEWESVFKSLEKTSEVNHFS
ncbi:MAG: hypothetical protein K9M07_01190 [Simkaniaceae bacterium]|nr:hypothetical protein [Simkaniaceae bacterium]MCF7851837.1 hypothetical protein [Simkaniaceae bacterium]